MLLALIGDIARKGEHGSIVLVGIDVRRAWMEDAGWLRQPARTKAYGTLNP